MCIATVVLAALVWACSAAMDAENVDLGAQAIFNNAPPSGDGGDGGGGGEGGDASSTMTTAIATEPNLKVAFIGDTGTGNDFKSVLALIKRESADLVMVQGDLNYGFGGSAETWFDAIDGELQAARIPYFVAKGNHDVKWDSGYGPGLKTRYASNPAWAGVTNENGDPTTTNYSVVYKGLKMVMVDESETSPVSRADYVAARLANDNHIWKICSWHKNQRLSNVGPKNDEMGWAIYENCRVGGAIVAQGHSHTYSRSKTLTNTTNQTVDPTCKDPFFLCVSGGPQGKHFFFDSSMGGQDTRSLNTSIAGKPYWASTYTGSFGALFIDFNVDGDPKKARGYFKTTANVIVDPPASSGKTFFTITKL